MLQKITKIQQAKKRKRRINIFLDGEYAFSCSLNLIADNGIHQGMELDENALEELKNKSFKEDSKIYVLNILSGKQYTEKAIRDKLYLRKVPAGVQDEIIEYIRKLGLLNEEKFIMDYIDYLVSQKKYSSAQIRQKLAEKKFPAELIERMNETIRQSDSREAIRNIFNKKKQKGAEKESIIRYLLSKGFAWDDVKEITDNDNKEE